MISGGVEDWNPKAAWQAREVMQINIHADILVARGTGARRALALA